MCLQARPIGVASLLRNAPQTRDVVTWLSLGVSPVGGKQANALVPLVAVGTTITGRPPHRSVRARLRIRLLPRMNGVEAFVGIRMQNTRLWNPPVQQWVETIPTHIGTLTATN